MEVMDDLIAKVHCFLPDAKVIAIEPISDGLIHATYRVITKLELHQHNFILQKINTVVFQNTSAIHSNMNVVSNYLEAQNYPHPVIKLCKTIDGNHELNCDETTWRLMNEIEHSYAIGVVQNSDQAHAVGAFFGTFHTFLSQIQTNQIQPVLPHFLDVQSRVDAFQIVLSKADVERKRNAAEQVNWMLEHQELPLKWIYLHAQGKLPIRLIHADPKISNVLFDATTNQPKAIIDWDTLMLGSILYDYGDMIRSYTNTKAEDDPDPEGVFNTSVYHALTAGFLSETHAFLSDVEIENMSYAPQVIVYIQAMRFLTDYLNGDTYYHCSYPLQNLNRAKNQINLLQNILKLK